LSNAQQVAVAAIERVCAAGGESRALCREIAGELRRVIPLDAFCFGTVDPATLLVTDHVMDGMPAGGNDIAAYNEYHVPDVDKFADLARSRGQVGILSRSTGGDLESSHRFRTVLPLIGARHEMRSVFTVDGRCWGAVDLFRGSDWPDFSMADADVMRAVSRPIARALRRAAGDPGPAATTPSEAGVLVLDKQGRTVLSNGAARWWLADGVDRMAVTEVASAARAGRDAAARSRVRSRAGAWVSLQGSPLAEGEAEAAKGAVAVVIERAGASDVAELLVLVHGLSARERQVLELLVRGFSSDQVATELKITGYTVRDHLKSIFAKCGVHSRPELLSRVLAPPHG
jgi:DNA-binding CsgD family transcriptional regulator